MTLSLQLRYIIINILMPSKPTLCPVRRLLMTERSLNPLHRAVVVAKSTHRETPIPQGCCLSPQE